MPRLIRSSNPGGEKYDSQAYGDNATTTLGSSENPTQLVTAAGVEKKDHPVARQILCVQLQNEVQILCEPD
jgi:hypothetical protein